MRAAYHEGLSRVTIRPMGGVKEVQSLAGRVESDQKVFEHLTGPAGMFSNITVRVGSDHPDPT